MNISGFGIGQLLKKSENSNILELLLVDCEINSLEAAWH
jgi:hypothetical protein